MYQYNIDDTHVFYTKEELTEEELSLLRENKDLCTKLMKDRPGVKTYKFDSKDEIKTN